MWLICVVVVILWVDNADDVGDAHNAGKVADDVLLIGDVFVVNVVGINLGYVAFTYVVDVNVCVVVAIVEVNVIVIVSDDVVVVVRTVMVLTVLVSVVVVLYGGWVVDAAMCNCCWRSW